MGDYLRSEFLDRVSGTEVSFLTRTSVLDRMCGTLCDAILGEQGSGRVLEQLEGRNLLVVPLDRRREWYRYHYLLRELLQAELRRREPDLVQDLHFRAAAWYEANAMPEAAIEHAQAAGDFDRVARLVLELAQPVWASGRVETVLRWMEWLRDFTSAKQYGAIAVHGSLIFALLGQPSEAERWAIAAERASPAGTLPDGSTMGSTLAYLRAILCRNGVDEMRRDAQIAWNGSRCPRLAGPFMARPGLVIRQSAEESHAYRWLNPPDSSFDMGTVTGCLEKWATALRKSSRSREAMSWLTPRRTRMRCTGMSAAAPVRV
jgi:LuxR family transcriptional regulator, maltose regulon positive regulatory protein